MRSELFAESNFEPSGSWEVFHSKMLRVVVTPDEPLYATKGAMVAYQGDRLEFGHHSGTQGMSGMIKKMVSSDNTPLMSIKGSAEVFLADAAQSVAIVYLEGDSICVNGKSLLAFEHTLTYDLKVNSGAGFVSGGIWSTVISGHGRVAIVADGTPIILSTTTPTYTDTDATVAWAGNLVPQVVSSMSFSSALRGGSGEAMQYYFNAPGWVAVQPSEMIRITTAAQTSQNTGFNIGSLFS
ncbi:MAG: AIM24 family protein [Actinobacteria bacterium]|nr:MAG: AIM24 family protein [Actinomycetota bacterium]